MPRHDGRLDDALRPTIVTPHWLRHALGSVLIAMGTPGAVRGVGRGARPGASEGQG